MRKASILCIVIAMEGIIWYRLLGNHPAASGKRWMMPFPGERVRMSSILNDLVKEHQINESIYKLDVQLMHASSSSSSCNAPPVASMSPIGKHDMLQNYDHIEITISRKNFVEELKEKQHDSRLHSHLDSTYVETESENSVSVLTAPPSIITASSTSSERRGSDGNDLDFQRVAALMKKFPLFPGKICRDSFNSNSAAPRYCVLCTFPVRPPSFVFPCCHFIVCKACKAAAESMACSDNCVVCGRRVLPEENGEAMDQKMMPREGSFRSIIQQEEDVERKVGIAPQDSLMSSGNPNTLTTHVEVISSIASSAVGLDSSNSVVLGSSISKDKASKKCLREINPLPSEANDKYLQNFGNVLKENLHKSLSLLYQGNSLRVSESEEKRHRSKILQEMDAEARGQ